MMAMKVCLSLFVIAIVILGWKVEPLILKQPHIKLDYFLATFAFCFLQYLLWFCF